ncbi:multisubstrate pseudouridine synthase 7 [Tilletia horrida]|nr:multisubstrate pseudouridine synthase 7 [Tilletia horrida]
MDTDARKRARPNAAPAPTQDSGIAGSSLSERQVGIEEYVDAAARPAFHAIIKQRFTDFQVFEVDPKGTIQHITDLGPPKHTPPSELEQRIERDRNPAIAAAAAAEAAAAHEKAKQEKEQLSKARQQDEAAQAKQGRPAWDDLDAESLAQLTRFFTDDAIAELRELWSTGPQDQAEGGSGKKPPRDPRTVTSKPLAEKADRTAAHNLVRTLFTGYLVSEAQSRHGGSTAATDVDADTAVAAPAILVRWSPTGKPEASAAARKQKQNHAPAQPASAPTAPDTNPPYLHFLLQKTNRDSHEALSFLTRALRLVPGAGANTTNSRGRGRGSGRGGGRGGGFMRAAEGGPSRDLAVAGTKDRRSVSVQRVSLLRRGKTAEDVWALANGCDTDFASDLTPGSANGGARGRGRGRGGRGRGGGGRGGFQGHDGDGPKSFLDALTTRGPKGLRIAHLTYADHPFRLGDLSGNEFLITLRNVKLVKEGAEAFTSASAAADESEESPSFAEEEKVIAQAMGVLKERGFINYYGMQRFGTTQLSTHELGIPLFKRDYKRAIDLLLAPRPYPNPAPSSGIEADVARARDLYAQARLQDAHDAMPRSYTAERTVLGRLAREEERQGWNKLPRDAEGLEERKMLRRDWLSAFSAIPKTMRMMYVHAYQSFIWNKMVSERVRRFGLERPVVGDYVFVDADAHRAADGDGDEEMVDGEQGAADENGADGEEDEDALANKAASIDAAPAKGTKPKVKTLTEADLSAGTHSITDVVMPLPGSEVVFEPGSWLDTLYRELLAQDGLTPADLGTSDQPEYALRGAYRKMLHVPRGLSYTLLRYTDPHIDLAHSDEDVLLGLAPAAPPPSTSSTIKGEGKFLALQLRLVLGTSAYATMALREVLKAETSSAAQRELTLKSEDQAWAGVGAGARTNGKEQEQEQG